MANRDLFEELKNIVRCECISDMRYPPWTERARRAIAQMELDAYPLSALSDAAEYLYSEKLSFASSSAAQTYFRTRFRAGG